MYFEKVEKVVLKDAKHIEMNSGADFELVIGWGSLELCPGLLCLGFCYSQVFVPEQWFPLISYAVGTDVKYTYSFQLWVPLEQQWLKYCV